MKPKNIKEKRVKEVRNIYKQRQSIWQQQRALGYYELEKPIRHGWFKELVIVTNVERYKSKAAILEIFEKLEKQFWGRTKDEASEKWQKQVSKYQIYKGLPTLSKKQLNKLSDKAKRLCVAYQYRNENKKVRIRFYVKIPQGAYKIMYNRAFVTHRKRIDPKLEQTLDLLEQQLNKNKYYEEHQKIYNYKNDWCLTPIKKSRKQIKNKLKQLQTVSIDEIIKENISWEKN